MAQLKNISFTHETRFRLSFPYLPWIEWQDSRNEKGEGVTLWCSSVNLPGVQMTPTIIPTLYSQMKMPSSDDSWGTVTVVYPVDELFENFEFVTKWYLSMTDPETIPIGQKHQLVDASLHILTNNDNLKFNFILKSCFPTSIGDLKFTKESTGMEDLQHSFTLSIDYWKMERY